MLKFFYILIFLFLFFPYSLSEDGNKIISGNAIVIDGDTIKIKGASIRLFGIDAPEKKQICYKDNKPYNCGHISTKFLKRLIKDSIKVDCYYKNKDRYKRIIAKCFSHTNKKKERLNLNYMMVRNGHAIDYKRYSKGEYSQAENIAKKERVGIWSGKFERPEDWRRKYK